MYTLYPSAQQIFSIQEWIALEENIAKSIMLGNEANKFFHSITRDFPLERKFAYLPKVSDGNIPAITKSFCDYLASSKEKFLQEGGLKKFEFCKKSLINGINFDWVFEYPSRQHNGAIRQCKVFNFGKAGGTYAIRELVFNDIYEEYSDPRSVLIVENLSTGLCLDIEMLFPTNESCLVPASMFPIESEEKENGKTFAKFKSLDLSHYNGNNSIKENETIACYTLDDPTSQAITYGNLVKKGGMLTLLHEIAHMWHASGGYMKTLKRFFRTVIKRFNEGRSVDKIFDKIDSQQIAINLLKSEFQAWRDAGYILIYLRKRGLDLEPEMSNDDINEYINYCLGTYRNLIISEYASVGITIE